MQEQQKRISLELAKKLHEVGFDKYCDYCWVKAILDTDSWIMVCKNGDNEAYKGELNAYDLLNDLCVTHAKELFGDLVISGTFMDACDYHAGKILHLVQQERKQEAEQYLIENCIIFK